MKNLCVFISLILLLSSCNSVKRNQKSLASGNYDDVIELAVKKISKDKNGKNSKEHTLLMKKAFVKVVDKDLNRISFLKKENKAENSREIYYLFCDLDKRQERINPLLPLGNTKFKFKDYSDEIIASKKSFGDYLFNKGNYYLKKNNTLEARVAHQYFGELKEHYSNYSGLDEKLSEAKFLGTDFVFVALNNNTGQIIPKNLEDDLLDFNIYGLDDNQTEYHSRNEASIDYNFAIDLIFRDLLISPERISEKEYKREKNIKDGWEYKLDRNGNVLKDSLGNDIKVDVYKLVRASVNYSTQTKNVIVGGQVVYEDLIKQRIIDKHPLSSEFVFENEFANYRGDKRALTKEDREFIEYDFIPFPSNEQMVFDAGEDIKARLKDILSQNSLR